MMPTHVCGSSELSRHLHHSQQIVIFSYCFMHSQGNKNQTHPDITLTINTVDIKAVYGGLVATEARPSDVFLLINQHISPWCGIYASVNRVSIASDIRHQAII